MSDTSISNELAEMCFTISRENKKDPWAVLYSDGVLTALNWTLYIDEAKERLNAQS